MSASVTRGVVTSRFGWLPAAVAILAACAWTADAVADDSAVKPIPAARPGAAAGAGTLDQRVKLLARELNLDEQQQADLRQILARQRDAVRKVWNDRTLLPVERAPATIAVVERTSDEIRGILSAEQKRKYNQPKPPPVPETKPADVSAWMDATRQKK